MPIASNHESADGCSPSHPQVNDKRLTQDEILTFLEYLQRTDHREYVDPFDPIVAPEVPALPDSVRYDSSPYDVLNDGFITPPDGVPEEFMYEFGYDERDFDQMEDDWFCIEFDPSLSSDRFLTGLQIGTEIGQIFLNSQVVIDTNGGFDRARANEDERGADWYRCDPGLGFEGAIPLWRTVPGGAAIELPEGTGVRMEAGWTFVLRVDFHTHYDAAEFERLDQNGEIDREAGTMTWFDQAWLRARWEDSVDRELSWVSVGPSTPAEQAAFEVPRGQSTLTYTASVPQGDYRVFSAEVSTGKLGKAVSLSETSSNTCVASNTDFSPKWIEQAIYAESDAPALNGNSTLGLSCTYRNGSDEAVRWGPEGEAAAWGRRERCNAVVWYYPSE